MIPRVAFWLGLVVAAVAIATGAPLLGIATVLVIPHFTIRLLAEINHESGDSK